MARKVVKIIGYIYLALVFLPTILLVGGCQYLRGVDTKCYVLKSHNLYIKNSIEIFRAQRVSLSRNNSFLNATDFQLRQPRDLMPSYITIDKDDNLSVWSSYLLEADFGEVQVDKFYRTTPNQRELDSLYIVLQIYSTGVALIRGEKAAVLEEIDN